MDTDPRQTFTARQMDRPITDHLQDYLQACRDDGLNPKNIQSKRKHLTEFLAWCDAEHKVETFYHLHRSHLQCWMNRLKRAGKSNRTVNHHRQNICAFCYWCRNQDRLDRIPFHGVKPLPTQTDRRYERRPLTEDEVTRLIQAAVRRDPTWRRAAYYGLAVWAGLRRGDCEKLRWQHVDLQREVIEIDFGKAKRKDRLPIRPQLRRIVEAIRPLDAEGQDRVLPAIPHLRTWRADFQAAGIPKIDAAGKRADFHALRMTLGSQCAALGIPRDQTQKIMRHADYRTTANCYVHVETDELRGAMDRLPTYLPDGLTSAEAGGFGRARVDGCQLRTLTVFPDNARANGDQNPDGQQNGRSDSGGGRRASGQGVWSLRGRPDEGGEDDRKG